MPKPEATNENVEAEAKNDEPDYKAMYEEAVATAEKWKAQSRKNEARAKGNAGAAKSLEETTSQLQELSERLSTMENENKALKAEAARAAIVAKVAKDTGVPESIVGSLAATDEEGLTEAATAIAQTYRPGGAPAVPEAGTFPRDAFESGESDWLREALTK